ncbi:substrate-binding domain-containing protein [Paenibacillus sp. GCM10012307]|uniref:GntR family transcriptional regulator n=1 Tax=Paenibacillus roseus TaxID=2798579 RepID=A0A934J3Y6_9BACL|nr:GntR family transcriptional regulator [Paenibacillus roseus]MBJ6359923.1 GntR family transcriptional regulator [Paenibacillus roseus]
MSLTNRTPLYKKVQGYIRELIRMEKLVEGDRIPTEKELMERFQVSKITVVNAMTGLASENVITRVPGRGSFVGAAGAQAEDLLEEQEESAVVNVPTEHPETTDIPSPVSIGASKKIIGIIMPFIHDYFAIRLLNGIRQGLAEKGYKSMIMFSEETLQQEKDAIRTLKDIGAEGLLIFPLDDQQYNDEILSMKLDKFPFVLIDRYLPGIETNFIGSDGRLGTKLAVDHLWQLGHREIAICSDSPLQTVTVQERIEGYMNAMKDKGALVNPAHIITGFRLDNAVDSDEHPLYRYIRNRMATAYITLNGELSVHIYQMAKRAGLQAPDDLSIISFDDPTSVIEDFSIFTHVKQFEYDLGKQAVLRLVDAIQERQSQEEAQPKYSKYLMEPKLIIRKTTGLVPDSIEYMK